MPADPPAEQAPPVGTPPVTDGLADGGALLADLAASIPGAMYRIVATAYGEWRFTYLSPGIHALYGIQAGELQSNKMALADCMFDEDRPAYLAANVEAFKSMSTLEHDYRIRARDGAVRWVQVRAVPRMAGPGPDAGGVVWTGLMTDVTERKRIEAELLASEETFRTLFETVPQGVIYFDRAGLITAVNPAAERILGRPRDALLGRNASSAAWRTMREDGSPLPLDEYPVHAALSSGRPLTNVVVGVNNAEGRDVWLLLSAIPLFKDGVLQHVYATFEDITERVRLSRELQRQATTDDLTGAHSRRSFMERLSQEHLRLGRHRDRSCGLVQVDLDHFKRVNDTWGHAAGDAVLRQVVERLSHHIRATDVLGRVGGEEFAILLPDTDIDAMQALAERLRAVVAEQPMRHDGRVIEVTLSMGLSVLRPGDASIDAVLARADAALYRAKQGGRNTVCVQA